MQNNKILNNKGNSISIKGRILSFIFVLLLLTAFLFFKYETGGSVEYNIGSKEIGNVINIPFDLQIPNIDYLAS
jgi:hypothetical protein